MCDLIKHTQREREPFQDEPHLTFHPSGNIKDSLCLNVSLLNATEKTYALSLIDTDFRKLLYLEESRTFMGTGCINKVYVLMVYLLHSL